VKRGSSALFIGLVLANSACTESAPTPVSLELYARGRAVTSALSDGTQLTLSRAELALGPVYLCAGPQAGQNCQTALAEWRQARVVDVLGSGDQSLGTLEGYTGRALSYMHDCGIVSLLTQEVPLVLPAAEELGQRSLELEGRAELAQSGAPTIPFRIALAIASSADADRGQPVVRSSPGQFDAEIGTETAKLTFSFDAGAWLTGLDQSAFWQDAACSADGPAVVCAGTVSQDCASETAVDCAESQQVCAPNQGCQDVITLDEETAAGRSVAQAITLAAGLEVHLD